MSLLRWGRSEAGSSRHVAVTFGTNIVLALMNAGTGIVLARVLGAAGRGELAAVQLWGLLLGTFAALGLPEAVVYFIARRRTDAGSVVASAMTLGLGSSLVFLAFGWFAVPFLLGEQSAEVKELAQWFLLIIPVFVLVWIPAQALRGLSSFSRWNLLRLSPPFLWLIVVVTAWLTGHFTVGILAFGFFGAFVVQLALNITVLLRSTRGPYRVEPPRWAPMLRFGIPAVLGSIPQLLNLQLDQLLLAAFVSNEQLGLYVIGVAWAGALAPLLHALGSVLFPRVAGEASTDERIRILAKGFRLATVLAAASVVVLLVLTYPGVRLLFGPQFEAAIPAALVLVVAAGVLAVANVLQEGIRGLGRPAEVLWSELGGLAVNGVLLVVLLGPLGIVGAALASLVGYFVTVVVLLVRLRHAAGRSLGRELLPTAADLKVVLHSARSVLRREPTPT